MEGYDRRSRRQDLARPVVYEGLPPGQYTLRVHLESPQHGPSEPVRVSVAVLPAWWQTAWARALFVVAAVALGVAAVRMRVRQLTAEARLVAAERDRIARELHDRHLQELVGALMIGRRLRSRMPQEPLAVQTGEMVALLERSAESARATVRMLTPVAEPRPYVEQLRFHAECAGNAFDLPVDVHEYGQPWRLSAQQRRHAVRIVNEAVINALKHARSSRVTVTVRWSRGAMETTIEDDGIGFAAAAKGGNAAREAGAAPPRAHGGGLGLENMRQLARAIDARLRIDARAPRGTRVWLRVRRPPPWSPDRWRPPPT